MHGAQYLVGVSRCSLVTMQHRVTGAQLKITIADTYALALETSQCIDIKPKQRVSLPDIEGDVQPQIVAHAALHRFEGLHHGEPDRLEEREQQRLFFVWPTERASMKEQHEIFVDRCALAVRQGEPGIEEVAEGRRAVPTGPAHLLIKSLDGLGHIDMDGEPNVGLVNPHAKRFGGDQQGRLLCLKRRWIAARLTRRCVSGSPGTAPAPRHTSPRSS